MRTTAMICASILSVAACSGDRPADATAAGDDSMRTAEAADASPLDATAPGALIDATPRSSGNRADDAHASTPGRAGGTLPATRDPAPVESRFLQNGALTANAFEVVNDGPGWADAVRKFEREGLNHPQSRDLRQLFGEWLRASLGRHGLALSGFGCGESLCAATIPLLERDARAHYANWRETDADSSPMPIPVFAESSFTWPSGDSEMRILFSTDPAVEAIQGP